MFYQSFEKTDIVQCSHMTFLMFNSCLIEAGLKSRWYENSSFTFSDQFPCLCAAVGFSVDWYACICLCECAVLPCESDPRPNLQQTVFFPLHFVNDWWITLFVLLIKSTAEGLLHGCTVKIWQTNKEKSRLCYPWRYILFLPIMHYKANTAAALVLASVIINRAFKCA